MRVTESLIRQNKIRNQQKQRMQSEDDEPTMRYKEEKKEYWAINQKKTVFDSAMNDGINTRGSVFDQNAVFRTQ